MQANELNSGQQILSTALIYMVKALDREFSLFETFVPHTAFHVGYFAFAVQKATNGNVTAELSAHVAAMKMLNTLIFTCSPMYTIITTPVCMYSTVSWTIFKEHGSEGH